MLSNHYRSLKITNNYLMSPNKKTGRESFFTSSIKTFQAMNYSTIKNKSFEISKDRKLLFGKAMNIYESRLSTFDSSRIPKLV